MIADNSGLVLHLDDAGVVRAVLFSNLPEIPTANWPGVSLLSLIDPTTEESVLFLLESVKEFGHAEAWPLTLLQGKRPVHFYCNAASLGQAILLVIYESSGNIISLDPNSLEAAPEVTAEPGPEPVNPTEEDLLEELSRLNNELVNTKRELIRQNVKLKRLQNPWEEGLTFI